MHVIECPDRAQGRAVDFGFSFGLIQMTSPDFTMAAGSSAQWALCDCNCRLTHQGRSYALSGAFPARHTVLFKLVTGRDELKSID